MNLYSPDELLSSQQVSDELQGMVSARTVTNWCKAGKLKASRAGGKWLIRRADLQAFLQRGGEAGEVKKAEPLAA
jgi:excisionase family DNA binding protein